MPAQRRCGPPRALRWPPSYCWAIASGPASSWARFSSTSPRQGPSRPRLASRRGTPSKGSAGAYLVNRFAHGAHAFDRPQDVFKFAVLAGLASTTVSSFFGVTSLALGGYADWAEYGRIWLTWWLGDAGGALIVAPVLLLWGPDPRAHWTLAPVE